MSQRKIRASRRRQVILERLQAVESHPTADEVYQMVRRRLPHISLGTVYRNLELLSKLGLIQKLRLGCAQSRFDGNVERHYHVRCAACGRVADVPIEPLPGIEDAARGATDFELSGHRLEFTGLCPKCKRRSRRRRAAVV